MKRRRPGWEGFTLLELLLAVVITAGLAAAALMVTTSTLRLWQRTQDRSSTQTQAALALDLLERDLQAAVWRDDGRTWLAVDVTDSADALVNHGWQVGGRMKPAAGPLTPGAGETIGRARFGLSGAWVRFITTNVETKSASDPGGSLPVAVAYQLARRPVSGPVGGGRAVAVRYGLFRSAVSAENTWLSGPDVDAAAYASSAAGFPAARTARSLANPNPADALAANVVDFGVWLYARQPAGGLARLFPATAADTAHQARQRSEFPVAADVMLRVLTDEGAVLLAAMESGAGGVERPGAISDDATWWWSVVEAHSQVYVRRVTLIAEAP